MRMRIFVWMGTREEKSRTGLRPGGGGSCACKRWKTAHRGERRANKHHRQTQERKERLGDDRRPRKARPGDGIE